MSNNQSFGTIAAATVGTIAIGGTALYLKASSTKESKDEKLAASRAKSAAECFEDHVASRHGALLEICPGVLYVLEASGCDMGPPTRNMVIYRIPGWDGVQNNKENPLVIYNAVAVDENTMEEIEALGKPTVLIVPNCYHRCCAAVYKKRYPDILVVCPAPAREKVLEIVEVDKTIDEWAKMDEYSKYVTSKTIDGWGPFENVLELQLEASAKGKKAVVVCDLLFTVPYKDDAGYAERFMTWLFDSSIVLPTKKDEIIVPKVARLSRIFAIEDWKKAENWYRTYAREEGEKVASIVVGHGPPVVEVDTREGCTVAFEGVADQLVKPRW